MLVEVDGKIYMNNITIINKNKKKNKNKKLNNFNNRIHAVQKKY